VAISLGKMEGMRSFRRPRHRWVDNIKTTFKIIDLEVED
jgi:hypothetical protein